MQITLMRHGKPRLLKTRWLAPFEMAQWIADYDRAEVEAGAIPARSIDAAQSASLLGASPAPRALSSVQALGRTASLVADMFVEAELPFTLWRHPRLPPPVWAALFRLLWLVGYSRGAESIRAAKDRAKVAARRLATAARHGPVLLVGHGVMNRLIAKELRLLGWIGYARHGDKYWGTNVYVLPASVQRGRLWCACATVATIATIALGMASRKIPALFPAALGKYPGDVLWTLMVFTALAAARPAITTTRLTAYALAISCAVEFSQLYRAPWIDAIRATSVGHLILGSRFSWRDLAAYAVGAAIGMLADGLLKLCRRRAPPSSEPT